MADFLEIFVNLSKTETAPSNVLDSDGAVVCDSTTQYGTYDTQLTYLEFKSYLLYRCSSRDIVFKFQNEVIIDDTSMHWLTINTGSTITFTSQDRELPYIFTFSSNSSVVAINVSNSDMVIENMDLELKNDGILHVVSPISGVIDSSKNNITFSNNRVWLNGSKDITYDIGGIRANCVEACVSFVAQRQLKCYNNIFNNKTVSDTDATMIVVAPPTGYSSSDTLGSIFYGNVFVRFYNFYYMNSSDPEINSKYTEDLKWNTFTGDVSSFRSKTEDSDWTNYTQYGDESSLNSNQYGWSTTPTVCDENLGTTTSTFDYHDSAWSTLDNTFISSATFSSFRDTYIDLSVYGTRDGKGSLAFGTMADLVISATPIMPSLGSTVSMDVVDPAYDSLYHPSSYVWVVDGDTIPHTTSAAEFVTSSYGVVGAEATAVSTNMLYSKDATLNVRVVVDSSSLSATLNTYNKDSVLTNTFAVGEDITVEIINSTSGVSVVKDIAVDGNIFALTGTGDSVKYTTKYSSIGYETILAKIYTIDNRCVYTSTVVNIVDVTPSTYYVDLSKEYSAEKNLKHMYGIYDNFEDKSIAVGFNSAFKSNYTVKYMYDEYVTNGVVSSSLVRGIMAGDFIVEGSFVRSVMDEMPTVSVLLDSVEIKLEWDYIGDRLNIYNAGSKSSWVYPEHIKDLSCDGALHKINFKFVYSDSVGEMKIYYSLDYGVWVQYPYTYSNKFTTVGVNVHGTINTGFGYFDIQADAVDSFIWAGDVNGSQELPFTYEEMYGRISYGGDAGSFDNYMCRNSRHVTQPSFVIDRVVQPHINVWDATKYGPWMLVFDNMLTDVDFTGSTISNGIIYDVGGSDAELKITNTFGMFITWNGPAKLGFIRYTTRYTGDDLRSDITGSTIKSVGGCYTDYVNDNKILEG